MLRWILISSLLFAQPLLADSPEPIEKTEGSTPASTQEAPHIAKDEWLKNVAMRLPNKMCEQDMDFKKCFETTEKECQIMVEWFASACLNQVSLKLPEDIDVPTGEQWGRVTGQCVYDLYQKFLSPKRLEKEGCPKIALTPSAEPAPSFPDPTAPDHVD